MKRTIPGLVLAMCWLILLLKGSFLLFGLVVLCISLIAGYEYVKMSLRDECNVLQSYLLSFLFSLPVLGAIVFLEQSSDCSFFITLALLLFYSLYKFKELANSYNFLCRLILGMVYIGFLGSHLVLLRGLDDGPAWLIILAGITAGSDTGAYFFGRAFGKHKLCPNVSPNKTIEGAVGGLVTAFAVTALLAYLLLPSSNLFYVILMAIPLTGASILGDLLESVIKRGTGTKDSGSILQGHGGVLDRVDSMLLASPVLYYMLVSLG